MRRQWLVLGMVVAALVGLGSGPTLAKGKPGSGPSCPVAGGATVVLDPGHGGSDTGAVNTPYNLVERDLNLDIANLVAGDLGGISVALTRYDNTSDPSNSERGEIANACGASVFVEIHLNSSSDPSVDYSETYWGKKNKDLAFSQTMDQALNALGIANNGVGQFANGGLLTATMPSTLTESVFLSNDTEAQELRADTRQPEIAQAIANGILAQLGS